MALTDYSIDTSGSPQDVQRKQALADALMKQGMDSSAAAGGKGGGWVTALNRGLAGALGGYQQGQANQMSLASRQADRDLLSSYPGLSATAPANPLASALMGSGAKSADTSGKIYNNDEPSPLDPPSGEDRRKMMATILGEENSAPGQAGVANVIRNRAVDGSYGGDTPSAVVTAKNQFEPWNTEPGRARMAAALADPKQAAAAESAIRMAYGEGGRAPEDPTEGKTMFYSPGAQAALGRAAPSWAKGEGQKLGQSMFYDDNSETPANSQPAQGQLPQVAQADPMAARKQELLAWAKNAAMSSNPQVRQMAIQTLEQMNKPEAVQALGNGYIYKNGKVERAYEPDDKTPPSKLEYDAYVKDEQSRGGKPVSYGQFLKKPGLGESVSGVDNSTLTGDEFLKTLPKGEADLVKKISEYDIDPKSLSVKGGHREDLLKKVSQYDGDYSEPLYGARRQAIKEFTSGGPSSPAGQITAGNTAILHAGEMSDALEKLKKDNGGLLGSVGQAGIPFVSYYSQALHNKGVKGTGTEEAKALSEFQTAKNHFSEEVTKFYAGSGGSEAERERALANIDEAKSLPELQSAIQQEARLMNGKINTLQSRIQNGMGPSAWKRAMKEAGGEFPIVQKLSKAELDKIERRANGGDAPSGGIDPAALEEAKRRGLIK